MAAEVIPLHGGRSPVPPVGHFLRIGDSGHRALEDLLAQGQFPARRVVVDASRFEHQSELVKSLQALGIETVLDTKVAELSSLGRYAGFAAQAPWASLANSRPLGPDHFTSNTASDVIGQIARFAVENAFDAVLAPTHWLQEASRDNWLPIDTRSCELLRMALDREGGKNVEIDYPLLMQHTMLRDDAERGAIAGRLSDLPFENIWVRASGFGADATPAGIRSMVLALSSLHNLGRPIISDYLGGMAGLALIAFGGVSGVSHGIAERERFDASSWLKPPNKDDDKRAGGRTVRVSVPGLGKNLTLAELRSLARARGGSRLCVCSNRSCCPHGLEDMEKHHRRHNFNQSFARVSELSGVPEFNRARHFVEKQLATADRTARAIKELKPVEAELQPRKNESFSQAAERLSKRLAEGSLKIERLRVAMEKLLEVRGGDATRAAALKVRANLDEKRRRRSE